MVKSLNKWGLSPSFLKFVAVGVTNTLGGYAFYVALLVFGLNYALALTLEYVAGIAYGFLLNKRWTFKAEGESTQQAWRFVALYGFIYVLNVTLLMLFVESRTLSPFLAQIFILSFLTLFSFVVQKRWIFSKQPTVTHDQ
jgi:putative flippase GtrA